MITLWILLAWIILGAVMAFATDRRAMKQEVPYGDMPSIASLKAIRTFIVVASLAFAPFILLLAIYRTFAKKKDA